MIVVVYGSKRNGKPSLSADVKHKIASEITDVLVRYAKHPKKYLWVLWQDIDVNEDWYCDGLVAGTELLAKDKDFAERFAAMQKEPEKAIKKELASD